MNSDVLVNGRADTGTWTRSRGLHYADGVFRTALILDGEVIDLDRQIAKLESDAIAIDLSGASARACRRDAKSLAAQCDRGVLKMLLSRKAQGRGYRPTTSAADRLLIRDSLPGLKASAWTRGIDAMRSPVALSSQPRLAGIKHLARIEQVLASAHWPARITEAIQCDASGRPVCGTRSNLFWIARGALYTPELSECGVAGVMRQKVLEIAQQIGVRWRICAGSWQEFAKSDEAFVTNSLIGIWPLRSCDLTRWTAPGPVTRQLSDGLAHPITGRP